MAEIVELERRLAAALDRLGAAHGQVRAQVQAAHARIEALEAEEAAAPADAPDAGPGAADALRHELEAAHAEIAALTEQLAAERDALATAKGQTEEVTATLAAARNEIASLRAHDRLDGLQTGAVNETAQERVAQLEASLQRVQQTSAQLRLNNAALRQALAEGAPDADLIAEGMKAELDALEAARSADRAEIDSILASLKPIVEERENA